MAKLPSSTYFHNNNNINNISTINYINSIWAGTVLSNYNHKTSRN